MIDWKEIKPFDFDEYRSLTKSGEFENITNEQFVRLHRTYDWSVSVYKDNDTEGLATHIMYSYENNAIDIIVELLNRVVDLESSLKECENLQGLV